MRSTARLALVVCSLSWCGCMVGPKYKPPAPATPLAIKEPPPDGWKEAQPADGELKGKWWEIFGDPLLNSLEEQVALSNQNVIAAEAQYREAKATVRVARSGLFPTVGTNIGIVESRFRNTGNNSNNGNNNQPANPATPPGSVNPGNGTGTDNSNSNSNSTPLLSTSTNLGVTASWEPDLWGSIRRGVTGSVERAQASAAQLEAAKLLYQSELASDYFGLRALDAQEDLFRRTVVSYQESLDLTRTRFNAGVVSEVDVQRAATQLYAAQTSLTEIGVARAAFEHAIAILTGKAPAQLNIPAAVLNTTPPPIPLGAPSALLERRPDIAAAERNVAAANEDIGIAKAAYFPALTLTGTIGFAASSFARWFSAPAFYWSVGPGLADTILDFGQRRGQLEFTRATYDALVANYRQTVLTALGQVEDSLAALRILERESAFEQQTIAAAARTLELSDLQYRAGTISYLDVITAQTALLQAQTGAVQLMGRRMVSSVELIQALGGGWHVNELPKRQDVMSKSASAGTTSTP